MRAVNISKFYDGHPVLNNVSLSFEEGGIYALMGPSGCGKTTLLHILAGLIRPDGGRLEEFSDRNISMVFQENRLCEFLTAGENVAAVQRNSHTVKKGARTMKRDTPAGERRIAAAQKNISAVADIDELLAEILPEDCLEQPVSEFSGGMKRRTAIARAILADSEILIMDEPLTGLDEDTKAAVISFIRRYRRGRTLIFSTHHEEDVAMFDAVKLYL